MAAFKRLNYKNHPSIANALVKVLAISTSFEGIKKLTTKSAFFGIGDRQLQEATGNLGQICSVCIEQGRRGQEAKQFALQANTKA